MLTFAYYLLKVMICSGILYGYYLLALRNKIFHRWNRFYLLAITVISLAAPLIKINIWQHAGDTPAQPIHFLQVVSTGDEFVYEYTKNTQGLHIDVQNLSVLVYVVISVLLFAFLIQTLIKINRLKKAYRSTLIGQINFINTDAKGTPFSFFNNIFWNNNIDINTYTGKQIFKHEVAHVQEKHSYDKIFMNLILIFFWCNPIFWLIRKELNMIHEFIADQLAVENNDAADFAAMILQATYPQQQFSLTNNFFYSPLKRRLLMLTKNKNPKINYLSRMLVLPLAALVFFAFTLKMKTINAVNNYSGKKITVVIDAGHGGDDKGISVNNIAEKDLALAIAKEIKDLNKNDKINIILSRDDDKNISVKDRIITSNGNNADLFISIHMDGEENKNAHSGLGVLIPKNDNTYLKESKVLGAYILESFRNNYQLQIANDLKQPDKGVWVLNANQCPAVLIEAGFLTTQKDFEYLLKKKNQRIIAQNILSGIEKYAQQIQLQSGQNVYRNSTDKIIANNPSENILQQNIPGIKVDTVQKDLKKTSAPDKSFLQESLNTDTTPKKRVKDSAIKSDKVNVPVYDSTGTPIGYKNIIPSATNEEVSREPIIFTKVQTEAQFPGGPTAWTRYLTKVIQRNINDLTTDNKSGTCRVRFIVNADGTVQDVTILSMQGTKLADVTMEAIRKGPKWIPANQNGHIVTSYKEMPVTFTIQDN